MSRRLRAIASTSRLRVTIAQLIIVVLVLFGWQDLPKIGWLSSRSHLFDPFFISSPTKILHSLNTLFITQGFVWHYMWPTIIASLGGMAIGLATGTVSGVLLGSSVFWSRVLNPFAVALNAIPRIALIPVVVIVFGPTLRASIVVAVMVVFFIVFFNAFEGAKSPPEALIHNAILMGASGRQIMMRIRLPYALVWTVASLPVVATFSMISVVTAEILTGYPGLGRLISIANGTADSTLTFAVVVVLSVLGLFIVGITSAFKGRILHWWVEGREDA